MTDRILVGLDGSPRQPAVLQAAIELARAHQGELHLARAMTVPVSVPAVIWTLQGEDLTAFLVEHGDKELATVEQEIEKQMSGLPTKRHTRVGQPHDVLCELATELDADVIVIGTHGFDRIDRFLGTTAAKVVNRAPCSVFVVRHHD